MNERPNLKLVSRARRRRPRLPRHAVVLIALITFVGLFLGALLLRNELFSLADGTEQVGGTLLLAFATVGLILASVSLNQLVARKLLNHTAWAESCQLQEHLLPLDAHEWELREEVDELQSRPTAIGRDGAAVIEDIVTDTDGAIDVYWARQQGSNAAAAPDLRLEREELHARLHEQARRDQKEITTAAEQTRAEIEHELPERLAEARREAHARIFPLPVLKGVRYPVASYLATAVIFLGALTAAVVYVTGVYPPYEGTEQPAPADPDAGLFEPAEGR
jgi:hypothetical protein